MTSQWSMDNWLRLLGSAAAKADTEQFKRYLTDEDLLSILFHETNQKIVAEVLSLLVRTANITLLCHVLGIKRHNDRTFSKTSRAWKESRMFIKVLVNPDYLKQNSFMKDAFVVERLLKLDDLLHQVVNVLALAATGISNTTTGSKSGTASGSNTQTNPYIQVNPNIQLMNNPFDIGRGAGLNTPLGHALFTAEHPLPITVLALIQNGADLTRPMTTPERDSISPLMWLYIHHYHANYNTPSDPNAHVSRMKLWWDAHLMANSKDKNKTAQIWATEFEKALGFKLPVKSQVVGSDYYGNVDSEQVRALTPSAIYNEEMLDYQTLSDADKFMRDKFQSRRSNSVPEFLSTVAQERLKQAKNRLAPIKLETTSSGPSESSKAPEAPNDTKTPVKEKDNKKDTSSTFWGRRR